MPYINAELQKVKKLSLKNFGPEVEVSNHEDVKAYLNYSADLSLQEVVNGLRLVESLQGSSNDALLPVKNVENDPPIPYFKKMDVTARDVRGPYVVPGSHRHRTQRVILSNGHGQYEA